LAGSVDSGLTRARIEVLRIELQRELEQLRRNLRQLWPRKARSTSDWFSGDADAGRTDQAESEVRDRVRARCAQIVVALDRIRRGTYVRCSICNREIPYQRLVVAPEASTCKTCNMLDSWLRPVTN
jgi:RNA polymerase-binding transcription factor DksA